MKKRISDKVLNIKPSGIRKFFDVVNEMPDAISLGVGEPDFDTPWRIREVGISTLEKGKTFYTSNLGLKELREEISTYLQKRINVSYNYMDEIVVTVGGSEAIDMALRAILNDGDEVIIPQPSYVCYEPCTTLAGGIPVIIPLKNENEFKLTKKELQDSITEKTKVLILPFPNNPTGSIMTRSELEDLVPTIIENDILVISDEIYSELTYKEKHVSISEFEGMKERTILINGFSKGYAMTGWRLGYAAGPSDIISQMVKIHQYAIMSAPTNSQYAAIEGLQYCDDDVVYMRSEYNKRREFLIRSFREMKLPCFEPYGAFYVFPCIKEFNMTSEEFAEKLLMEEKVACVPGNAFGDSGEGFLRISYAYSMENLQEAIIRISRFINRLREK